MLEGLTVDSFAPCLGQEFGVEAGAAGRFGLELVEARRLGEGATDARAPFALLFRGPPDPILPQAIYPLTHDTLGELAIFIVPVARTAAGTDYEAIFA